MCLAACRHARLCFFYFSTVWSVVKTVLKTNGPLGFYQGLTSTIVRDIPGNFCFFGAYELCRTTFAKHMGTDKEGIGTKSRSLLIFIVSPSTSQINSVL